MAKNIHILNGIWIQINIIEYIGEKKKVATHAPQFNINQYVYLPATTATTATAKLLLAIVLLSAKKKIFWQNSLVANA